MRVYPTEQLAFSSDEARQAHARRYKNFEAARHVWIEIDDPDRAYILEEQGYADVDGAIERERAAGYDLSTLKATGAERDRLISAIRFYSKSERQTEKNKARPKPPPDVFVRKHERELRAKALRRAGPRGA